MGRVRPSSELVRNRGVRRWLWRYIIVPGTTRVPLNIRTSAIEQRWPEHGSRLVHENDLLRGVPRLYGLCLSTGVVECYRREIICCGGRVILKTCTAYIHIFDFMAAFLIVSILDNTVVSDDIGCRLHSTCVSYQEAQDS